MPQTPALPFPAGAVLPPCNQREIEQELVPWAVSLLPLRDRDRELHSHPQPLGPDRRRAEGVEAEWGRRTRAACPGGVDPTGSSMGRSLGMSRA